MWHSRPRLRGPRLRVPAPGAPSRQQHRPAIIAAHEAARNPHARAHRRPARHGAQHQAHGRLLRRPHSKLRPHFKAHKTPAIARRQLAAGSCTGLTCATVGEAEIVARERLCDQILIANEIVGPGQGRPRRETRRGASTSSSPSTPTTASTTSPPPRAPPVPLSASLVDVGVGLPRCGIAPGEPAVALAKRVEATPTASCCRGVMGYEGHVVAHRRSRRPRGEGRRRRWSGCSRPRA